MSLLTDTKLFIPLTDTTFDTLLQMIIDSLKDRADQYMGLIHFATVTNAVAKFDGGVGTFFLPHANATVASVVRTSASDDDEYDLETIDPVYYYVDSARGVLRMISGTIEGGRGAISITYSGGYGEASAPATLLLAMVKQAAFEFRRRKDPGLSATTYPDGTIQKFDTGEWLPDVKAVLDGKRRFYI